MSQQAYCILRVSDTRTRPSAAKKGRALTFIDSSVEEAPASFRARLSEIDCVLLEEEQSPSEASLDLLYQFRKVRPGIPLAIRISVFCEGCGKLPAQDSNLSKDHECERAAREVRRLAMSDALVVYNSETNLGEVLDNLFAN